MESEVKELSRQPETDWLRALATYADHQRSRQLEAADELARIVDAVQELLAWRPKPKGKPPTPSTSTPSTLTTASTPAKPLPNTAQSCDEPQDLKAKDGAILATVSRKGGAYVVTPKVTIAEKTGVYANFLNGGSKQILPNIARKHSAFRFWPVFENGSLVRLELQGVDDNLWTKKLRSPLVWAFDRAREQKS